MKFGAKCTQSLESEVRHKSRVSQNPEVRPIYNTPVDGMCDIIMILETPAVIWSVGSPSQARELLEAGKRPVALEQTAAFFPRQRRELLQGCGEAHRSFNISSEALVNIDHESCHDLSLICHWRR